MFLVLCIHTFMQPATLKIEAPLINQRKNHITTRVVGKELKFNIKLYTDLAVYQAHQS